MWPKRNTLVRLCLTAVACLVGTIELSASELNVQLLQASQDGKTEVVRDLLKRGAKIDSLDERGWSPLMRAIYSNHQETAELLIRQGADVQIKSKKGSITINFAADRGSVKLVQLLLDKGAPLDGTSDDGATPLFFAANGNRMEIARYLISKGANVNPRGFRNEFGNLVSPLMAACLNGHREMAVLLLENGAKVDRRTNEGTTVLMEVAKMEHSEVLKLLIAKGANVHVKGPKGHTALIYAGYNGQIENIKLLLAAGADAHATATDSENPDSSNRYDAARLARQQGHLEAYELLEKAKREKPAVPANN